ncbi:MAG: sugar-binding protein [Candidatus Humimicrobiaceae bacterium]
MRNKYKKLTFLLDRFPYIIFIVIIGLALVVFFAINSRLNLNFFSQAAVETEAVEEYNVFIASPTDNEIYDFINTNESVPIEVKAKEIENKNMDINVMINGEIIKTFTAPPYEFNWNPKEAGEYKIQAQAVNDEDEIVAVSNEVSFSVNYDQEESEEIIISEDIEEKKARILSESQYRKQNDVNGKPIFSYKCYTPPLIDADIQEWDIYEKFSNFVPTIKKENYTSHTDISGTFYSCWDEDNFYFAVQVIDDVFSQSFTGDQLNNGDSVVIVLDTDLEGDYQIQFLNSDDYQIEVSPGNFNNIAAEAFIRWPSNSSPNGADIKSSRLSNGYLIEASIPWDNFTNYHPQDEDMLGFTISILDTDHLDSTELVISSSKQFDFNNTFTLGNIVLIDAGDLTEEDIEE